MIIKLKLIGKWLLNDTSTLLHIDYWEFRLALDILLETLGKDELLTVHDLKAVLLIIKYHNEVLTLADKHFLKRSIEFPELYSPYLHLDSYLSINNIVALEYEKCYAKIEILEELPGFRLQHLRELFI